MKRIFLVLSILMSASYLFADTPFIIDKDGKIVFARKNINGNIFYYDSKADEWESNYLVSFASDTSSNYSTEKWEVALSTTLISFSGGAEFDLMKTKEGVFKKLLSLKQEYDLAVELDDTAKISEIKVKYDYLKHHYKNKAQ